MKFIKNSAIILLLFILLYLVNYKIVTLYYEKSFDSPWTRYEPFGFFDIKVTNWLGKTQTQLSHREASQAYELVKNYSKENLEFLVCSEGTNCNSGHLHDEWKRFSERDKKAFLMAILRLQIRTIGYIGEYKSPFSYRGESLGFELFYMPSDRKTFLVRSNGKILISLVFDFWESGVNDTFIRYNIITFFNLKDTSIKTDYRLQNLIAKDWDAFYSEELKMLLRNIIKDSDLSNEVR